jgi:hypothetical protein
MGYSAMFAAAARGDRSRLPLGEIVTGTTPPSSVRARLGRTQCLKTTTPARRA